MIESNSNASAAAVDEYDVMMCGCRLIVCVL